MAKKQTIASEIGSALGAVAARAEQLIASNPTVANVVKKVAAKPTAKRTTAAKHSTATPVKKAAPKAQAATPKQVVVETPAIVISQEAIAEQAYLYWEARGYQGGDSASDWARAEHELMQRALAASAK